MSRYQLNKAMWVVAMNDDPEPRKRFEQDPAAFSNGFELTDEEREAYVAGDIGKLYSMGVQPFVLLFFAQVRYPSEPGPKGLLEFMTKYRQWVAPHGNPDFAT